MNKIFGSIVALGLMMGTAQAAVVNYNNGGAGFGLVNHGFIDLDSQSVGIIAGGTSATGGESFAERFLVSVTDTLDTISAAINFQSSDISGAVLSVYDGTTNTQVATSGILTPGTETTLSYQMTNPPGSYWVEFSGFLNAGTLGGIDDGYLLKISAVPVPAAALLFGSGLIGMLGFGRRKDKKGALTA